LRILYNIVETADYPAAMAVSVPKRLFRRAVDRNLLKRRIREAYRLNKQGLYPGLRERNVYIHLVIQFVGRNIESFQSIEKSLLEAFQQLALDINGRISG
jgi:ribonuclease P protein component